VVWLVKWKIDLMVIEDHCCAGCQTISLLPLRMMCNGQHSHDLPLEILEQPEP
jgi:hypothetical protein